jgi:hypothetical protein
MIFTRNATSYAPRTVFLFLVRSRLVPPPASLPHHHVGVPVSTAAMPLLSHRLLCDTEPWGSQICWHLVDDVCWEPHKGCTSTMGAIERVLHIRELSLAVVDAHCAPWL